MIPELGKYAQAVLSSYGVSIAILVVLIVMSVLRSRRVRKQLDEVEQRSRRHG